MTHVTLCALVALSAQTYLPLNDLNLWLKHSALVVVGKYVGPAGTFDTRYGTSRDDLTLDGVGVRMTFEVQSVAFGEYGGRNLIVTTVVDKPREEYEQRAPEGIPGFLRPGKVYLLHLRRPDESCLVYTRTPISYFYHLEATSQFDLPFANDSSQNLIGVPDIPYRREGSTAVEAFVSVLSQAFAAWRGDDETRDKYLYLIDKACPRFKYDEDGERVVEEYFSGNYRGPYEGPSYFAFFDQVIRPRLLAAAGSDPEWRLRVYNSILRVANREDRVEVIETVRNLILEVDRTHPDPEFSAPIGPADEEWCLRLLSARLKSFRAQAVDHLPRARRLTNVVLRMLDDPEFIVRLRAVVWFERTYEDVVKADPDAPRVDTVGRGEPGYWEEITARAVRYWKARFGGDGSPRSGAPSPQFR